MTRSPKGMSRAEADAAVGELLYSSTTRGRKARRQLKQAMKAAGQSKSTIDLYLYTRERGLGGFRTSRPL